MIEVEASTKRYGDKIAVDDLSFTVSPGMVTGFLGPNGAGKSTTMRMILGLDAPTVGHRDRQRAAIRRPRRPCTRWARCSTPGRPHRALGREPPAGDGRHPGIGRRRVEEVIDAGRPARGGQQAGGRLLARDGPAARHRGRPAGRPADADPRRAGQRARPRRACSGSARSCVDSADEGRTVLFSSHLMSEMALTADHLIVIGRGRADSRHAPAPTSSPAPPATTVRVRTPDEATPARPAAGRRRDGDIRSRGRTCRGGGHDQRRDRLPRRRRTG